MTDKKMILDLYTLLWNNRSYSSFEQMEQSILSELSDENTHPRVRRAPGVKFQITRELISQSDLAQDQKKILIKYVTGLYEQNFNK
ncbi:hypothetical protein [Jeotgalibacillus malaysiensis]|uniref:hypothetical protein n=1 Tax=Jeotgalibacillus malaysiensis TaxID=1508404 RepID=UPI00384DD8F6